MKTRFLLHVGLAAALLVSTGTVSGVSLGTAFTYQGKLTDGGNPPDGDYNFQFNPYEVDLGGDPLTESPYETSCEVEDGLFTVEVDFGAKVFDAEKRWCQGALRTGHESALWTDHVTRAGAASFLAINRFGFARAVGTGQVRPSISTWEPLGLQMMFNRWKTGRQDRIDP